MRIRDLTEQFQRPPEIAQFSAKYADPKIISRVQSQAARSSPPWLRTLSKAMAKYNFTLIGEGINGAVFQNEKYPYVLKVYRRDAGYDEWVYFSKTHSANKHVPKFRGQIIYLNENFRAVRVEPLEPCSPVASYRFIDEVDKIQRSIMGKRFNERDEILKRFKPDLVEVALFLNDWEGHSDLTQFNVMARKNGDVVIIDPIYINPDGPFD